jgi:hypothetical protein
MKKEDLRKIIREEVEKALTVKVTWEKKQNDDGTPLAHPEIKTTESNLCELLHHYIPRIEGAIRGMQEDIDKTKENLVTFSESHIEMRKAMESVGRIMIAAESSIKEIMDFSKKTRLFLTASDMVRKMIGETNEGDPTRG